MAVPVLSRLTKEPEEYRLYYANILSATCLFSFPIAILSFLMSKEIIFVFLGDQWGEASEIFSYLALVVYAAVTH
jgi:O-antigen/teichoic acid export membrane protein